MQETATLGRDLARRVYGLTGTLATLLAAACAVALGPADAVGVLAGSALMLANFAGLRWVVARVMAAGAGPAASREGRAGLWIGASGARLGLVAVGAGLLVAGGGVGLRGFVLSLLLQPLTVVITGLRAARMS